MKHLNSKEVNWIKYSDIEFTELLGTGFLLKDTKDSNMFS